MKKLFVIMVGLSSLISTGAMANAELAKSKNCMACHSIDNKLVGPAFKDVSSKYAGQKDAEAKLALKIQKGGSGSWGAIPMPANPQLSDAEAKALAKWALAQK